MQPQKAVLPVVVSIVHTSLSGHAPTLQTLGPGGAQSPKFPHIHLSSVPDGFVTRNGRQGKPIAQVPTHSGKPRGGACFGEGAGGGGSRRRRCRRRSGDERQQVCDELVNERLDTVRVPGCHAATGGFDPCPSRQELRFCFRQTFALDRLAVQERAAVALHLLQCLDGGGLLLRRCTLRGRPRTACRVAASSARMATAGARERIMTRALPLPVGSRQW